MAAQTDGKTPSLGPDERKRKQVDYTGTHIALIRFPLDEEAARFVQTQIAKEDLFAHPEVGKGRTVETDIHITVHLGMDKPTLELRKVLARIGTFQARLYGLDFFAQSKTLEDGTKVEWDLLYVIGDGSDRQLRWIHAAIGQICKVEYGFPMYIPHATLARVKKGMGLKYSSRPFGPFAFHVRGITWRLFGNRTDKPDVIWLDADDDELDEIMHDSLPHKSIP